MYETIEEVIGNQIEKGCVMILRDFNAEVGERTDEIEFSMFIYFKKCIPVAEHSRALSSS